MPITKLHDEYDEDWCDEDSDESEDDDSAPCPECGEVVYVMTGKCPACGYWLSAADRRNSHAREAKPMWLKLTAVVVLVALLVGMFGVAIGLL
jgi:hypothetical protein